MTIDNTHNGSKVQLPDGKELVVVSNRQPYRHCYDGDDVVVERPVGGLSQALDTVLARNGGTWVAWGDGEADEEAVGPDDRVAVPPEDPAYTLQRVWLTDDDVERYYYGFSNRVLWPLCHSGLFTVEADRRYWQHYVDVNRSFADAVGDHADRESIIWLQDYHLALAPRMIRESFSSDAPIAHFWHIPWPSWDVFRACPHGADLLHGLLGNDFLGFHTGRYRDHFLECVDRALTDATVDSEAGRVDTDGSSTVVSANPIGVPTGQQLTDREVETEWSGFLDRYELTADRIGIGVDRLDYTKGIPERLLALKRLWAEHPEWRERFTYVNIASESRSKIEAYQAVQSRVQTLVDEINETFGTDDWQPVVHTTRNLPEAELYAMYRRSDVALVSPVRDGMNLVAQEYVAAQTEDPGVLVLGEGAGAHERLGAFAVSVNPYDTQAFSDTIHRALTMPRSERAWRMEALHQHVTGNDIWTWVSRSLEGTLDARQAVR